MSVAYASTIAVATATYPATAQYIPTNGGKILMQHPGTVNTVITFSFDGTNDSGYLLPGSAVATEARQANVWFKGAAATSTTIYVSSEFV